MSKETAVSQIFAQMKAGRKDTKFWNDSMLVDWLLEQEERYKEMEKEQIEDAWLNGMKSEMIAPFGINRYRPKANEYYNETYGGQDE
jgi:hypothetical protein